MKRVIMAACGLILASAPAFSAPKEEATKDAGVKEFTIVIKDHKFSPETLEVPAGEKVKLIIDNQDPTPEEFESHSLHREKIIKGNSKGVVAIGPLKAGEYDYFGEFNEATAKGKIIVK